MNGVNYWDAEGFLDGLESLDDAAESGFAVYVFGSVRRRQYVAAFLQVQVGEDVGFGLCDFEVLRYGVHNGVSDHEHAVWGYALTLEDPFDSGVGANR